MGNKTKTKAKAVPCATCGIDLSKMTVAQFDAHVHTAEEDEVIETKKAVKANYTTWRRRYYPHLLDDTHTQLIINDVIEVFGWAHPNDVAPLLRRITKVEDSVPT